MQVCVECLISRASHSRLRDDIEKKDKEMKRMGDWSYTPEQKEELKMALAAGVPKATILTYFYPEVTAEKMSSYRMKQ